MIQQAKWPRSKKAVEAKWKVTLPFASPGHIPHPRKETKSSWTPRTNLNGQWDFRLSHQGTGGDRGWAQQSLKRSMWMGTLLVFLMISWFSLQDAQVDQLQPSPKSKHTGCEVTESGEDNAASLPLRDLQKHGHSHQHPLGYTWEKAKAKPNQTKKCKQAAFPQTAGAFEATYCTPHNYSRSAPFANCKKPHLLVGK